MSNRQLQAKSLLLISFFVIASEPSFGSIQTYSFSRITANAAVDISPAFSLRVFDASMAFSETGQNIGSEQVGFRFLKTSNLDGSISEIYFDGGTNGEPLLTLSSVINNIGLGTATSFSGGSASPGNLPGGNSIFPQFAASSGFVADRGNGNPSNGVDQVGESVAIVFDLIDFANMIDDVDFDDDMDVDFDDLVAALNTDFLRVGMHVVSIGNESDSFVSTTDATIPEPSSFVVWGLLGIICANRSRSMI